MRRNVLRILGIVGALVLFSSAIPFMLDDLTGNGPGTVLEAQGSSFAGYHTAATAQTATGQTAAISVSNKGILTSHTIGLVVTGGPSGCTYRLQGSRDGTNWFNISAADITCTSSTVAYEANKPFPRVRGNLLTLTGGTAPTVTLHYVGK